MTNAEQAKVTELERKMRQLEAAVQRLSQRVGVPAQKTDADPLKDPRLYGART